MILVTSDWHLNDKARDRYRHDWQHELRTLVIKHQVSTVVMLGDLTDEFDNHPAWLVNSVVEHLQELVDVLGLCSVCGGSGFSGQGTGYGDVCSACGGQRKTVSGQIYIMRGNHDYVDPDCPFFKFTAAIPGVTWINSPCVHEIEGTRFQFLPHTRDYKVDWAEISFRKVDMCFAHNTFDGTVSESGMQLSGIPPSFFPKDLPVISGDIHKRQDVGNITYVGSPYTVDFGDDFKPRVLLLTEDSIKSIPCTGPQKRLITPKDDSDLNRALKEAAAAGDIVKLRYTVGKAEADNWGTIKRKIAEQAVELGVRLHGIEGVMDAAVVAASKKRVARAGKAQRDDEILSAYCKSHKVEDPYVKVGQSIIKDDRRTSDR